MESNSQKLKTMYTNQEMEKVGRLYQNWYKHNKEFKTFGANLWLEKLWDSVELKDVSEVNEQSTKIPTPGQIRSTAVSGC